MAREVPSIPTGLDAQTRNFFSAIREAVNEFTLNGGSSADTLNSNLTADNLTGIANSLDKLLNATVPPKPLGVVVTGIFSTIMVTWNNPNYTYYSFAEIWRANALDSTGLLIPATGTNANGHSINFATDAKLVGTSNGQIYTDKVEPATKYYYWVRFLSEANIAGPYNSDTGLLGSAVQTINDLMIANGWTVSTDSLLDGLVTSNKINDFAVTNAKIANAAITNAKIANLAVSNAQIQDLAVTSAKIQSLAVEKLYATSAWIGTADILDGTITNAKIGNTIQSDNYNGSNLGWQLSKNGGTVNLNQLTIRDAAGNIIMSSGIGVNWGNVLTTTGAPTRNVFQGNWAVSHAYTIGDIVLDTLGYGWSCVLGHTSGSSTTVGIQVPVYTVDGANSNTNWSLYAVKGTDTVSVILSNDTHVFPANSLGVPTYTGSGTTINVYDGTREVIYDGLGSSIGTWNVTAVGTNIAVSTKVDSGNYVTYPDMSSGVDSNIDASKIVYTISGKSYSGTAFIINSQQSFAKSKAGIAGTSSASAAAFAIANSGSILTKDASGTVQPSAGISLTTYNQNISSTSYQWYKDGVAISGATLGSYTIPTSDYTSTFAHTYKCIITGTVAGVTGQTLEDSITIPLVVSGSSSPVVILSNESSNFPAPLSGTTGIVYTGGNCDITAYIGTTKLAYAATGANTFSCTNVAVSGCTVATGTGTSYTYSVVAPVMTADKGYNDVIITIRDGSGTALSATITKRINYALSRAGVKGNPGDAGDSVDIIFVRSATVPATPTASTGTPTLPIVWYTNVTSANTAGGLVNPLYSSTGFKTASVGNYTWDTPVRIDGTAVAEVTVFVRSATAPATPTTGGTYTFSATPAIVAPTAPIAWSTSVPSGTNPVYTSRAVVSTSSSNTAAVAISGWSAPILSLQNGIDGAQGPTVQVTTNRVATFTSKDNTLDTGQAAIAFTATTSGITAASYAWTFYADNSTTAITSTTLGVTLSGTPTGQVCTVTQANFAAAVAGVKSLKVVCVVNGVAAYNDAVTIRRMDNSTAAAGATVGAIDNLAPNPWMSGTGEVINGWTVEKAGNPYYGGRYVTTTDSYNGLPWDVTRPAFYANGVNVTDVVYWHSDPINVDSTSIYCLSIWARKYSGSPVVYLGLSCYNSAGASLGWVWNALSSFGGLTSTYTQYSGLIGQGQNNVFPSGTVSVRIGWIGSYYTLGASFATQVGFHKGLAPIQSLNASNQFSVDLYNKITPTNVSTYIANLAVDTLQIAGNAISYVTKGNAQSLPLNVHGTSSASSSITVMAKINVTYPSVQFGLYIDGVKYDGSVVQNYGSGSVISGNCIMFTNYVCTTPRASVFEIKVDAISGGSYADPTIIVLEVMR